MQVADDKRSSLDHTTDDEKPRELSPDAPRHQQPYQAKDGADPHVTERSRGVMQMELLQGRVARNTKWLIGLYGGFLILAYVLSLDQYTTGSYQTQALSVSFKAHSVISTMSVVKSVFQASQPPIARLSDFFGRVNIYLLCVFLYTLGYIIVAASNSVYPYAVGICINVLGITGLFLLQNIIISEISSTRNRIFWSIFPSMPGAINVWVSGDIASSFLSHSTWRWGYGLHVILTPVLSIPIISLLAFGMRKGKQDTSGIAEDVVQNVVVEKPRKSLKEEAISAFWQLDIIGLILLVGGFGLFLVAITLANGKKTTWDSPQSLAMLIVGAGLSVIFFFARSPLLPFKLLTNRTVVACLLINIFHPVANGTAGGFFYTWLLVAANRSVKAATRIRSIPQFVSLFSAISTGVLARYTRRIKPWLMLGFAIEILGIGASIEGTLIGVQIVRGIGSGMISFPTQAMIQTASKHENIAAITAASLLLYYIGSGVGSAIGGGIWTNTVPSKLQEYMTNSTLARSAFADPISFIKLYKRGTVERAALDRAQDEAQRTIVTVACCIAAIGFIVSCFLENHKLTDTATLPEIEDLDEYGKPRSVQTELDTDGKKSGWLARAWRF